MTDASLEIARADVESGGGPLATAAGNANRSWSERRGLLLRLVDDRGAVGRGEASPLIDYSPDTLAQASDALSQFAASAPRRRLHLDRALGPQVASMVAELSSPSARFAAETALLDLAGQRLGCSLAALHADDRRAEAADTLATAQVGTCTLIAAGDEQSARRATAAALKLKIGRASWDDPASWRQELDDVARVVAAVGRAPSPRPVRVDVNGRWPVDIAVERCEALAAVGVEFIEQPAAPDAMPALLSRLDATVPIAVDESLHHAADDEAEALFAAPACRFAVLKPMVLGGGIRAAALASRARRLGVEPVVSHLFDGPIAMAAYCELALFFRSTTAAGLSHHAGLDAWSLPPPGQLGERAIAPTGRAGLGFPATPSDSELRSDAEAEEPR